METPCVVVPATNNESVIAKNDETMEENDYHISSKNCEYDGYTSNVSSNEDLFCQSTKDNRNSTEFRDEKMENCADVAEPLLISTKKEKKNNQKEIINGDVKNNTTKKSKKNDTSSNEMKKKNKKRFKLHMSKKSCIKFYSKIRDKLVNSKTKLIKNKSNKVSNVPPNNTEKQNLCDHNPVDSTPINSVSDTCQIDEDHERNPHSILSHNKPRNKGDYREITVINANGETMFLPAKRRIDSMNFSVNSRLSVQTDTTINPKESNQEKTSEETISAEQKNKCNDNNQDLDILLEEISKAFEEKEQDNKNIPVEISEEKVENNNTINNQNIIVANFEESRMISSNEINDNKDVIETFIENQSNDDNNIVDNSEKKKLNENTTLIVKEIDQDNDMIGAGISMIKPFHPENENDTIPPVLEDNTKNIDLPLINENVDSTPSVKNKDTPNENTKSEKLPEDEIKKRKLSLKYKPLKTSLKKGVYSVRYFRKPKEEPPKYLLAEDFEQFKETMTKSFDEMKNNLLSLNNDYIVENNKLKDEIIELRQQVCHLEEEKEQLRSEVTEEIIKLQDHIRILEEDKEKEVKQLKEEIAELHQREDNYQDVIEHHLFNINTSLVKLKDEDMMFREEMVNEIKNINEKNIMNTNPDELVRQAEIENISKQIVMNNVQWNELSHSVQDLPIQLKKDVDDKFEAFEKDQIEKRKQFEDFISETKNYQIKLEEYIQELEQLQKDHDTDLESQTRSLKETISIQNKQLEDYEETKNQLMAQNKKLEIIGDRVDHYCTNDYLDTVIELEDLRKITNRTTEELFNLQKLNLYCKNLDRLPKRIFSLENLNELWLGRNNLNTLSDKIGCLVNLKRLSVADNNLSQLPSGIKNLKNLTHLYLYKNKLKELPPEIGELENLIHLDVESNKLIKLPDELKKLSKLEHLDIENNAFNEFPEIITELKSLVKLNLSINKFFFIPRELENLIYLKSLNLKNNFLRSFPYSIIKFTSLEELDLSNNLFKDIPSEIRYLNKLKSLNLANVKIEEIIPEFGYLKELKILNLSNCNIRVLPNCLRNLQNLEEINLVNNEAITMIPEYFRNFKNLKKIILNRNVVYKNGMEFPRYQGSLYNELLKMNIIRTE